MSESTYRDFYPTPSTLCWKLTNDLNLNKQSIVLEPSAGKGNLADHIRIRMGIYDREEPTPVSGEWPIDTIEINTDLQHVLRGKGYRVIHDDFLSFETFKRYDAIIANFPFSDGDKHLAKALDLIETNGGHLRCYINAETIRNQCSHLRESLSVRLAKLDAEIEFIADGFKSAERATGVEVAFVKVYVKPPAPFSYVLNSLQQAKTEADSDFLGAELVETDFLKQFTAHFAMECQTAVKLLREFHATRPYMRDRLERKGENRYDTTSPIFKLTIGNHSAGGSLAQDCNGALRILRGKYWRALFADPQFTSQYTSNILKDLHNRLTELENYDFTLFNIRELQKQLNAQIVAGVEKAILDLFDKCSRQHSYWKDDISESENIWFYNGWKTNKAWKINKKIILPLQGFSYVWDLNRLDNYGTLPDTLTDMVKVFNYLAADKLSDVRQLVGSTIEAANQSKDFTLDMQYFRIKLHKKGTAHIWFKDMELLDKFNIFGSQRKGWLPPSYGHKKYEEMNAEEKQVVNAFQGEAAYKRVMRDKAFYLVDSQQLARLTAGELPKPEQSSEPELKVELAPPKAQKIVSHKPFQPATPQPTQDTDSVLERMEQMVNGRLF